MAKIRFLKPGEVSNKNRFYVKLSTRMRLWQIVSFIELIIIIYGVTNHVSF